MVNQQLLDYIKQQVQQGVSREQIKNSLMTNGWLSSDIEEGFNTIGSRPPTAPTVPSPSQIQNVQQPSSFINPATEQQDFINKWSWGGFFLYVVYFIASRNYKRAFLYFLGTAVPILNIWLWVKSGLHGRKLVWESGKWQNFESYQKRQKILDKVGIILFIINILVWIAVSVFGMFVNVNNSSTQTQSESFMAHQEVNQTQTTMTCTINSFTATPDTITKGQASTLTWSTNNCSKVVISGYPVTSNFTSETITNVYPNETTTYIMTASNTTDNTSPTKSITVTVKSPTQQSSNSDIERVKIILKDIRQGYLTGNEALVIKHLSVETAKIFASANSGFKSVSTFIVGNVSPLGKNILANITSSESTLNGPMVFIKENGDWKMDLNATMEYYGQTQTNR